jgi:stearoyl-CoA desaturase (delta-9 desaturase)
VTRPQRLANALGVFLPAGAVVLAIVLLWDTFVGPEALALALVLYLATGLGISVGFHRMLAHRSFEASPSVRATLAVLGSMAMQGPVTRWVANHRKHHAFADEDGDPHSPHVSGDSGVRGAVAGLWHAHVGWIFTDARGSRERYAKDLLADPLIVLIDRASVLWVLFGLALPFGVGWALAGTLEAALIALLWGGPVRIFALQHMSFAVNSLCHFAGRRRFDTSDESRNLGWLAPFAFGEAWHNNHHAFPSSAFHGLRRWDIDPGGLLIRGLERLGLVWNVRRITPERQERRQLASQRTGVV